MVLVVFNLNTRDRSPGVGSPVCEPVWSVLSACVERVSAPAACLILLALSACGGCATPQPLGFSCRAFSTGQVMSRGMNEGQTSVGESRGMQQTRLVCSLIYSQEELEAELGQDGQ